MNVTSGPDRSDTAGAPRTSISSSSSPFPVATTRRRRVSIWSTMGITGLDLVPLRGGLPRPRLTHGTLAVIARVAGAAHVARQALRSGITFKGTRGRIRPLRQGAGVVLTGEFDLANHRELGNALDRLVTRGGDVRVDMARVTFADLGAISLVVRAAQALPPDRRLILIRPPGIVGRVLDLCWPGLDRIEVID